jgi:hypothetical protein
MFKISLGFIFIFTLTSCSSSNTDFQKKALYKKQLTQKADKAYKELNKELE